MVMNLLDECLEALGQDKSVFYDSSKAHIFKSFEQQFPITNWRRIDWKNFYRKIEVESASHLQTVMKKTFSEDDLNQPMFILWDEASLPVVETNLNNALRVIDDVTAVSFDTWFFSPSIGYEIEFYHEGEITIGLISSKTTEKF